MKAPAFSIWSSFDIDLSPEDMVLELEKRGMTVCELSDEHASALLQREGDPEEIGKAFGTFAAKHGVRFPQGHLWLFVRLCDKTQDAVGILTNWIKLFSGIGIRNAVLHCDGHSFPEGTEQETILASNAAVLKKLAPIAEQYGVRICLENLIHNFNDAETLLDLISRVGSSAFGICLDTGHLNIKHPGTQEQFILTAGDKLHAIHIADNEGKSDQHMMPFGKGTVDFASVMKGLSEIGYGDLFNYEIPGERHAPLSVRRAKTEFLKNVTEYLFSLI
ncbi:MAG: sugar phosphate isomerase/epimerase [Clostridiales bacterium]|nr:sugar phosphate isomerase/epimerase [Candidatus Coliplasma caballi]